MQEKLNWIDNEKYIEYFNQNLKSNLKYGLKKRLDDRYESFLLKIALNDNEELINFYNNKGISLYRKQTNTYKNLVKVKKEAFEEGIFSYIDAYFYGNKYIIKYPQVKNLLQSRFKYVFVDEMQDMDNHQYQILEDIFYDKGKGSSVYQRIGDKNQSIYNGQVKSKSSDVWTPREKELEIKGSHRLSKSIADVVKYFGLSYQHIEGLNKSDDGSDIKLSPHLLVYNDETCECKVIHKYVELIKKYQQKGEIPSKLEHPVKAVSWVAKEKEEEKITLPDYCPKFDKAETKSRVNYNCLESYLIFYDKDIKILKEIQRNILNSLIRILRIEEIKDEEGRYYSKRRLLKHLRNEHPSAYETLKLNLYNWCISIIRNKKDEVLSNIQEYIEDFLSIFSENIDDSDEFINNRVKEKQKTNLESADDSECEPCKINGEKIEVNTVHSIKGETHTAALYLESFYYKDGRGENAKSYESQRLHKQFKREKLEPDNAGSRTEKSAKVLYVGFSRPTHLLVFAVHEKRYNEYLKDIDADKWEVKKL
jgi:superfamily I DNA/RNA helicase